VAGDALRVTLELSNKSAKQLPSNLALVNLYYGAGSTPATSLSGPGSKAFPRTVAAGASASGRFVFNVPKASQGQIEVEFSYSTEAPTVIFKGSR